MSWSSRKKEEGIFCTNYFVRMKFFNIYVLSQCILYRIHFQNIHTFTYQKTLLHALFCMFLKSSKAFSVSLSVMYSLNTDAPQCGHYFGFISACSRFSNVSDEIHSRIASLSQIYCCIAWWLAICAWKRKVPGSSPVIS